MGGLRIAMWSGPRNISTAMLRSWGSRPDTAVIDEPLYANYLKSTGAGHPGAGKIIAHAEATDACDWRDVVPALTGPIPGGKPIWYQKHMAHHLLPGMDLGWLVELRHCLLVREPARMLASLTKVIADPAPEETGLPQQVELFRLIKEQTGSPPPVLVSSDVLRDPQGMLTALCGSLGVPYTDAMLSWAPGPRETDGIWAPYWYDQVERSTGFAPYAPKDVTLPDRLAPGLAACQSCYDELLPYRLTG